MELISSETSGSKKGSEAPSMELTNSRKEIASGSQQPKPIKACTQKSILNNYN
jgi:hypothetical protein